jgi:hypothetical protein
MHPPFLESISWIISPFKFWTATIFLHAHLQVVYYNCIKFHKTPISRLGGVALTKYMDGRTGWFLYTPAKKFVCGGYKKGSKTESSLFFLHLGGLLLRKWVRLESLILIPTFIYFKNHCIKISVLFIEQKSLCLKMDDNKPIS